MYLQFFSQTIYMTSCRDRAVIHMDKNVLVRVMETTSRGISVNASNLYETAEKLNHDSITVEQAQAHIVECINALNSHIKTLSKEL